MTDIQVIEVLNLDEVQRVSGYDVLKQSTTSSKLINHMLLVAFYTMQCKTRSVKNILRLQVRTITRRIGLYIDMPAREIVSRESRYAQGMIRLEVR